jgi:divalent metal cation (Fe/Co/Zn/Cd) transporter
MKPRTLIAAALIVVGILAFVYLGITYTTTEDAIDIGPLKVTTQETHTIPLPPIVGGIALVGGIIMLAAGGKYV